MINEKELPEGWRWMKLGEIVDNPKQDLVDGPFGSNLKSNEYVETGIPVFKIQNIKANRFVDKKISYVTTEKANELSRHSFKAGDLIITKLGEPLGLCCKVPEKYSYGIIVADLMRLRPSKRHDIDYLTYVINSEVVQNQFKEITKGTTRARVNLSIVREIKIPICNLREQQLIVSKIEELFSEVDKGIETLQTALQQLKTYRQAVLKWAFEDSWKSSNIGNLFDFIGGGTPSKKEPSYWNGNINWASVKDIKGDVLTSTIDSITELGYQNSASNIADPGQVILITRISPGKPIITRIKTAINQDLKIVKPKFKTSSLFIYYLFKSIERECIKLSSGTTVLGINLNNLKEIKVPLIEFNEQQQIVSEIESRLSVADKLEESITHSLQQAQALKQSILKKAFEGRLVG